MGRVFGGRYLLDGFVARKARATNDRWRPVRLVALGARPAVNSLSGDVRMAASASIFDGLNLELMRLVTGHTAPVRFGPCLGHELSLVGVASAAARGTDRGVSVLFMTSEATGGGMFGRRAARDLPFLIRVAAQAHLTVWIGRCVRVVTGRTVTVGRGGVSKMHAAIAVARDAGPAVRHWTVDLVT